jgi:predicted AAA+ superfamily ATPase
MIQRLPAWGETLGKRLSAHPKVHVIGSGLAGWLLGLSAEPERWRADLRPRVATRQQGVVTALCTRGGRTAPLVGPS